MRPYTISVIAAAILLPILSISANKSNSLKQLEDILKTAAQNSPIMLAEDLKIAEVDASRLRGRATYLPEVKASYDLGGFHEVRKSINSDDATRFAARYTVRATHPLYRWGAVDAMRKVGFGKESIAQLEAQVEFSKLCSQLRKDYFSLVAKKAELSKLKTELNHSASGLEKMKLATSKGQKSEAELAQTEIFHQALIIKETHFKNKLLLDIAKFQNESGSKGFSLETIPSTLPDVNINITKLKQDFEKYKSTGFNKAAPTKLAKLAENSIKDNITVVKAKEKPTFDIGVGMSQGPYENSNGKYELQTVFFAGITGQWTLFDRAETTENLRSLLVRKRLVDARLDVTKNKLLTTANGYLKVLEIGMKAIDLRKENVDVSKKAAEIAQLKYDKGQIDLMELNLEKQNLATSEFELIKDKANILTSYYAFKGALFADPALNYYDPYKNSSQ